MNSWNENYRERGFIVQRRQVFCIIYFWTLSLSLSSFETSATSVGIDLVGAWGFVSRLSAFHGVWLWTFHSSPKLSPGQGFSLSHYLIISFPKLLSIIYFIILGEYAWIWNLVLFTHCDLIEIASNLKANPILQYLLPSELQLSWPFNLIFLLLPRNSTIFLYRLLPSAWVLN